MHDLIWFVKKVGEKLLKRACAPVLISIDKSALLSRQTRSMTPSWLKVLKLVRRVINLQFFYIIDIDWRWDQNIRIDAHYARNIYQNWIKTKNKNWFWTCWIVEHHFPHFTYQSGATRHFPTVFDSFSHFPTFSDSFWQFFTDFSTFRHFPTFLFIFPQICAEAQRKQQICEKMNKNVGKCRKAAKMCGERRKEEKAVKNRQKCRKMSGDTRLVRKMRKAMLDNTTQNYSMNWEASFL